MNNPLTLEERASVPKLLGHDTRGAMAVLRNYSHAAKRQRTFEGTLAPDAMELYLNQVYFAFNSVKDLTIDFMNLDHAREGKLLEILGDVTSIVKRQEVEVSCSGSSSENFMTNESLLYSALYNLAKNSARHSRKKAKISLSVSDFSGKVPEPAYQSPDTPLDGKFIVFNVHDNGPGFPKGRDPKEFLKLGVSSDTHGGFGLYFVNLVCKYLRSHLVIDSKPGNTNVAIYHPLNLK
jgi:signal transduction histidine kinase